IGVIAVDQDPLGIQGFKYKTKKGVEVWFKPLSNGELAFAALNRNNHETTFEFRWRHEPIHDEVAQRKIDFNAKEFMWKDLWNKDNTGDTKSFLKTRIAPHDIVMLRLVPVK